MKGSSPSRLTRLLAGVVGVVAVVGCTAPTADEPRCVAPPPRGPELLVAGSGVWTGVIARGGGPEALGEGIRLAPSIGSGGALKALLDGEIDVGLLSRELRPRESKLPIDAHAAHPSRLIFATASAPVTSRADALRLYREPQPRLPSGARARPLAREPGDSGWPVICAADPELCEAMKQAVAAGRAEVAWTDAEMARRLAEVPGAVGPIDLHWTRWAAGLPPRTLGWARELHIVTSKGAAPPIRRLVDRLFRMSDGPR